MNYQEIAEAMADLKIRTRTGKPLTVDNLRKTLQRVVKDKEAEKLSSPQPLAVKADPSAPVKPQPPQIIEDQLDDEDDFADFKPMRLRP